MHARAFEIFQLRAAFLNGFLLPLMKHTNEINDANIDVSIARAYSTHYA